MGDVILPGIILLKVSAVGTCRGELSGVFTVVFRGGIHLDDVLDGLVCESILCRRAARNEDVIIAAARSIFGNRLIG